MKTTEQKPLAERITQGRMHAFQLSDYTIIGEAPPLPGAHIARLVTRPDMEANAELIAEAFNITHETGRTPRQLAEDVEACKKFLEALQPGKAFCPANWQIEAHQLLTRLTP
jgi:hypothetical protein